MKIATSISPWGRWRRSGSRGLARCQGRANRGAGSGAVIAGLHLAVLGAAIASCCGANVALLKAFYDSVTTLCQPPDHLPVGVGRGVQIMAVSGGVLDHVPLALVKLPVSNQVLVICAHIIIAIEVRASSP